VCTHPHYCLEQARQLVTYRCKTDECTHIHTTALNRLDNLLRTDTRQTRAHTSTLLLCTTTKQHVHLPSFWKGAVPSVDVRATTNCYQHVCMKQVKLLASPLDKHTHARMHTHTHTPDGSACFSCNTLFPFVPEPKEFLLTGEDQSQADQPNCLTGGLHLNLNLN
jgi:hypothetical protein